jgi:hypothetical protein
MRLNRFAGDRADMLTMLWLDVDNWGAVSDNAGLEAEGLK